MYQYESTILSHNQYETICKNVIPNKKLPNFLGYEKDIIKFYFLQEPERLRFRAKEKDISPWGRNIKINCIKEKLFVSIN